MRDDCERLRDILEAIERIERYAKKGRARFEENATIWKNLKELEYGDCYDSQFESIAAPLVEWIAANGLESRTLAAIRDALLPKLLSGEIQVKDAERFIEDRKKYTSRLRDNRT